MKDLESVFQGLKVDNGLNRFDQYVAGNAEVMEALQEFLLWPKHYAKEAASLGVNWPNGLLLYGPSGCGKTLMTKAVCEACGYELRFISSTSVFGAYLGESERNLREIFEQASKDKMNGKTIVLFFDEIDSLCPKRSAEKPHESRVVSQLLTLIDEASFENDLCEKEGRVVIIAATNQPNALDLALRRPGRFDKEIEVRIPNQTQRFEILKFHSREMPLSTSLDLSLVAEWTHGYSGADLSALCREAAMQCISTSSPKVVLEDFKAALVLVPPSVGKGYEVEVSPVKWDDIGGLEQVKKRLKQAAQWPLLHREAFERLGLKAAKGILLYGPSGCCKTTLAKAVATECRAHLIPLSCAQVYSMYSGEGEDIIREAFHRARLVSPSIIFLDEVDAMAATRSIDAEEHGIAIGAQLLSCLLTEMDGLEQSHDLLVLAATNKPEKLDKAFIRPGRIDMTLFVGPPDEISRNQILSIHTKKTPLDKDVDFQTLAHRTELFTGAELAALCSEASICALREDIQEASIVKQEHFEKALLTISPSLTIEALKHYKEWGSRNKILNLDFDTNKF